MRNSINNDRLSDTTRMLTAVATILLVPGLVAGIYGMNIRNLPYAEARFGFWGVSLFMALLGAGVWFAINRLLHRQSRAKHVGDRTTPADRP